MVWSAVCDFVDSSRKGMFGVEDAESAVAQAIVDGPSNVITAALLGGRSDEPDRASRIRKWKDENRCKVCGQREN